MKIETMRLISRHLYKKINDVFCGYLRQPICAERLETGYLIQGRCAFNGKLCTRLIEKGESNEMSNRQRKNEGIPKQAVCKVYLSQMQEHSYCFTKSNSKNAHLRRYYFVSVEVVS